MTASNERFTNNYDFLRIVAAVCIAFTHSFNLLAKNPEEPLMAVSGGLYDFSFIGLCIFFSISGYLITKSACTSSSFLNYCWKRFLRIQPLLIIVTLVCILVIGPLFTDLTVGNYFSNLSTWTYLRNVFPATGVQFFLPGVFTRNVAEAGVNGSLWTLVLEERLYLFVSILFLLKGDWKKCFIVVILIMDLLYALHSILFHHQLFTWFNNNGSFFALVFLNAGAFFLLGIDFKRSLTKRSLLLVFPLVLVSLIFTQLFFLEVLLVPALVIGVANIRGITNKAGQWGDFTYGIYIFAFPVQQVLIALKAPNNNPYLLFGETMLIVLPLAILSWHFIEKKFLGMKKIVR